SAGKASFAPRSEPTDKKSWIRLSHDIERFLTDAKFLSRLHPWRFGHSSRRLSLHPLWTSAGCSGRPAISAGKANRPRPPARAHWEGDADERPHRDQR